jgi:hypothetical protein
MTIFGIIMAMILPAWFVTLAYEWFNGPKTVDDPVVAILAVIGGAFLLMFWVGICVPDIGHLEIGGYSVWAIGLVGMFVVVLLSWPIMRKG